jgi:hypothetical protein
MRRLRLDLEPWRDTQAARELDEQLARSAAHANGLERQRDWRALPVPSLEIKLLPRLSHSPPRLLQGESEDYCRLDGRYRFVGRGGLVAVGHHLFAEGGTGRPSGPGRPGWAGCSPS